MRAETYARRDRAQHRRPARRDRFGMPAQQHDDQRDIAQRVEPEGGGGADDRDQQPAERRPDAAREVEGDGVERDRLGQIPGSDLQAYRGLPRWAVERGAAPDRKREEEDRKSTRLNSSH